MVALENLVVGVTGQLHVRVNETGVDSGIDRLPTDACVEVVEDGVEPLDLFG